jgi:GTP cyclohydrolase IA
MDQQFEQKIIEAAKLLSDFPYDSSLIEKMVSQILDAVGEDTGREGLLNTPQRVARSYEELFQGYRADPVAMINDALFETECEEPVLIRDIEFFSMCEHHLLPIIGRAHVEYIPGKMIIGLSKIPRVVDMFAHRMQIQEKMTSEIANFLNVLLEPKGVAVMIEGLHLCSMIRGVKKHDASMTTTCMMGKYETDYNQRKEFYDKLSRAALPLHF